MNPSVLVVGAGPVGLTMAAELVRFGISVRIIDKAPARSDKSKALAIWSRTLELLQRSGSCDAFLAAGLEVTRATICWGADVLARVELDHQASPYPFALLLAQPETERLLEEHLAGAGVSVERGLCLDSFSQDGDRVLSVLSGPDGGSQTIETDWLVGCDGAHSAVRHGLGVPFLGDTLASRFLLADVKLSGSRIPADEITIVWHADGAAMFFPMPNGRFRFIADLGEAEVPAEVALADAQVIADQRVGAVNLSDPVWLSLFTVNERMARDFRTGRVFLAGDAAHIHSPAGGQGMNTGMQDAFNLAWKLALVARGNAAAGLLDSYHVERSAVASEVLADSGRLTRVALARSHLVQTMRNFAVRVLFGFAKVRHAVAEKLSEASVAYPDSPLTGPRGGYEPDAGERIVDSHPFGGGDTPRFAVMAADDGHAQALLDAYRGLLEAKLRSPPDPKGLWLVRPDGYVGLTAHAGDWEAVRRYLDAIGPAPGAAS